MLIHSVVHDVVQVSFIMRNASGKVIHEDDSCINLSWQGGVVRMCNPKFMRRSEVFDDSVLRTGALIFDVDLQYKPKQTIFYLPPNPLVKKC